jgi:poly(beta-D-mannuronate) C5 epimerase
MSNYFLSKPFSRLAVIALCSFIGLAVSVVLFLLLPNFGYSQFPFFSSQGSHDSASPLSSSAFQTAAFAVPIKETRDAISYSAPSSSTTSGSSCILYDPSNRTITVSCSSARLSDVYNQLHDNSILAKQSPIGIWFLSANLVIAAGATLNIDSTDTKWLKINSKAASDSSSKSSSGSSHSRSSDAYIVDVIGSLQINSVKITSWDPTTNFYAITNGSRHGDTKHAGDPRPYIKVEKEASGTTDIINSEIAYLGYEKGSISGAGTDGLNFYGCDGSIIKNNNIHDLYFGLYTFGVGHMIVENNSVRNSGHYGLDPHTGTHDMIFRNNTVYGNGGIGIICSLNCYNILIENNKVHDNAASGIMFSRNMTNSIARNNIVYNEDNGIFVSQSSNNQIYKNIISNNTNGINVGSDSSANTIINNTIIKLQALILILIGNLV